MHRMLSLIVMLAAAAVLAWPLEAMAQAPASGCPEATTLELPTIYGARSKFLRLAEVSGHAPTGPDMVRRLSTSPIVGICGTVPWSEQLAARWPASEPWLRILPVRSVTVVNTGYPSDRNNGALWAGQGPSTELSGGLALRWGVFSAAAAPKLLYAANGEYPLSALARNAIDLPQRMGTGSFARLDPGQSYARVDAYGAALGVSTENLWLGPGLHSSILLSSTAPGFPHAFVGTSSPADIHVGRLAVEAFWGRLVESPVFDTNEDNDHRLLAGLVVGFEPGVAPGLHLGAARIFQQYIPPDGLSAGDYFPFFRGGLRTGEEAAADASDELFALYLRWVLPESGLEVFAEGAKFDGNADFHDLLVEPDNGRAYLVGLQKIFDAGPRWVRLHGEVSNLAPTLPILHRQTTAGIYRHSVIRQGHTHRGQLLGAWTGPGSDSQIVGGDLLASWGSVGVFGERVRRNADIHYSTPSLRDSDPPRHDVELTAGTRGVYFWRDIEVNASVAYSHRRDRDFLPLRSDDGRGYRVDSNWNLQLGLTWHPGSGQRTLLGRERSDEGAQ